VDVNIVGGLILQLINSFYLRVVAGCRAELLLLLLLLMAPNVERWRTSVCVDKMANMDKRCPGNVELESWMRPAERRSRDGMTNFPSDIGETARLGP